MKGRIDLTRRLRGAFNDSGFSSFEQVSHNPQFDRYPSHAVRRRRVYRYLRYRHRKVGTTRHPLAGIRRLRFIEVGSTL